MRFLIACLLPQGLLWRQLTRGNLCSAVYYARTKSTWLHNPLLVVGCLIGAWLLLLACQQQTGKAQTPPARQKGAPSVPAFVLSDQEGQPFSEQNLRGRWTLLFFGFTHCPDVCPLTLGALAQVWQNVEGQVRNLPLQVVLVSVDPDRDSPQVLAEYLQRFNPKFIGLRGDMAAINRLAKPLGIYSERQVHPEHAGHIEVKHSPAVLLVDPNLQVHTLFTPPLDIIAMTNVIKTVEVPVVP